MIVAYTWPDAWKVRKSSFHIAPNTRSFESPLSRQGTDERLQGERWIAKLELVPMLPADYQELRALLHRCDGRVGRLLIGPTGQQQRGIAGGAATGALTTYSDTTTFSDTTRFADGSDFGQVGTLVASADESLVISGLKASSAAFEMGDVIQVGTPWPGPVQLLEVVNQARSNSSGQARVAVRPRLRYAYPVGTLVTFKSPRGLFRLTDGNQVAVDRMLFTGQHAITLEEAI